MTLLIASHAFSQIPAIEPGVSHELAKWRAERYSDVRYQLNLTLEKMSPVLKGTIEIRVKVGETGSGGVGESGSGGAGKTKAETRPVGSVPNVPIILDWRRLKGHEERSTISNVTVNGLPVTEVYHHAFLWKKVLTYYVDHDDHLVFRDGVKLGENIIKLDFTSPILTSGSAITRYVDKEDGAEYIYSLFVPSDASTAFPVFDQPDLKARFDLCISAPDDWQVVSNSSSARTHMTDHGPFCISEQTKPISTYVFAFAAGPFEEFAHNRGNLNGSEGVTTLNSIPPPNDTQPRNTLPTGRVSASDAVPPISVYVRKSQVSKFKPHAAEVFRINREGIKYLEEYFDYKFPFPKYDIVLIPEFPFGGMEHAGATFLREDRVIFPTEPSANDYITRANLIFHEAAHQWFGDTVTMRWFDDLWLKEGFAEFMAYKTLERVMPEYNAWKIFYERNKQAAYLTDSTKGTTPIYQPIANLSNAKSAYGNIVYRKAPSFLKQAEFYIGPDQFQTAVRSFLKKHEFANAGWEDLATEFQSAKGKDLKDWANRWVTRRGLPQIRFSYVVGTNAKGDEIIWQQQTGLVEDVLREQEYQLLIFGDKGKRDIWKFQTWATSTTYQRRVMGELDEEAQTKIAPNDVLFAFPNYQDYGYGIFLLDDESCDYVLKNIQNEKDDFLRSMMWGSLWESVREAELDPKIYVELVLRNRTLETDESTIQTLLGRVSTALNYYVSDSERGLLAPIFEDLLIDRMQNAGTPGERVTYFRSFVNNASTERGRRALKQMIADSSASKSSKAKPPRLPLRTKDRFDVVTRLAVLGDPDAEKLLAELERTETSDEAKRYAYAARAGFGNAPTKARYWNDFINDKKISESWIEAAFGPFNSISHADITQRYLTRALAELPNLKRDRKIFFINGWLAAFIGGQRDEKSLAVVNKFLADNPALDKDLRLKILENVDLVERAVRIRTKFAGK